MLCRNVYSLAVKLGASLKIPCNVRELCSVKTQHIGKLCSVSPSRKTYGQSFITTTTNAKIFYRRFVVTTCQNCRKHDDFRRGKRNVQQVNTYSLVNNVMRKRNCIKTCKIYWRYFQYFNWKMFNLKLSLTFCVISLLEGNYSDCAKSSNSQSNCFYTISRLHGDTWAFRNSSWVVCCCWHHWPCKYTIFRWLEVLAGFWTWDLCTFSQEL